jgi:hypothetical protein
LDAEGTGGFSGKDAEEIVRILKEENLFAADLVLKDWKGGIASSDSC